MAILLGRMAPSRGIGSGWIDLSESPFRISAAPAQDAAGRCNDLPIPGHSVTPGCPSEKFAMIATKSSAQHTDHV
jgi:hypothetical protein